MNNSFIKIAACRDVITSLYNPDDGLFVEREWLVRKFEEFEQDFAKRHLIIVGEPGIGKSAFIAYLAHCRNAPRHFIRASTVGGIAGADPRSFLVSIGAQLCQKYGSDIFKQPGSGSIDVKADSISDQTKIVGQVIDKVYQLSFLAPITTDISVKASNVSGWSEVYGTQISELVNVDLALDELTLLHVTLLDPVREIQKRYPTETVVILINALDEASWQVGKRIVDIIPQHEDDVPTNLRLVMTSRPGNHLVRFRQEDQLRLDQGEYPEKLLEDAERYILNQFDGETLRPLFEALPRTRQKTFVAEIKTNSSGNFLYLYYFFNQLIQGVKGGDKDLSDNFAPEGLKGIYRVFLIQGIKKDVLNDIWRDKYCPILGIMAVAYEPLSKMQIANFSRVELAYVDEVINKIKQFLTESLDEKDRKTRCYRFYHRSIDEYLLKDNPDDTFVKEDYHRQIASHYKQLAAQGNIDHYGLVHLAKHLEVAGQEVELYTLLTASPDWMNRKRKVLGSDRPYVHDLELAIANFNAKCNDPLSSEQLITITKLHASRQVVHLRSGSYDDRALETLVWLGKEKEKEALEYAESRAGNEGKIRAFLTIHKVKRLQEKSAADPVEPDRDEKNPLDQALEVIKEIEDDGRQTDELRQDLAIALAEADRFEVAKTIANDINNVLFRVAALRELAVAFARQGEEKTQEANEVFQTIEDLTRGIQDDRSKAGALRELAIALAQAGRTQAASDIYQEADSLGSMTSSDWQQMARLRELAVAFGQAKDRESANAVLKAVETLTRGISEPFEQVASLRELAIAFAHAGEEERARILFKEIEDRAHAPGVAKNPIGQAMVLLELAVAYARARCVEKAMEIFNQAMAVPDGVARGSQEAAITARFAETLAQAGFITQAQKSFRDARDATAIMGDWEQSEVLRILALASGQAGFTQWAHDVFTKAEALRQNIETKQQEQALSQWALLLAEAGFTTKASVLCIDAEAIETANQIMELDREAANGFRQKSDLSINSKWFLDVAAEIKLAKSRIEVQEVVDAYFENLSDGVFVMATAKQFSASRKLVHATEDNLEQISILNELARSIAWLGDFKEAFNTTKLKNRLDQSLNELVEWLWAAEDIEQKPLVKIFEETIQIFAWTDTSLKRISERFRLNDGKGEFPTFGSPIESPVLISSEQLQSLEEHIQEAVTILYHTMRRSDSENLESVKKIVLDQISEIANTKINFLCNHDVK